MRARILFLAGAASLLGACGPSGERDASEPPPPTDAASDAAAPAVRSEMLVTGEWLAGRLEDPEVVVLHVGPDRLAYEQGHVPGARYLPLGSLFAERDGIANELPDAEHLDSVFESVGVGDGSRVVVYGPPLAAARTFFTLDQLGHGDRTALLDGGLEGWRAGGHPLTTHEPEVARASFTPRPGPERVVDADWVLSRLEAPAVALLDARPAAQYSGADPGGDVSRAGHIPGAGNLFWEETLRPGDVPALKDPESLRALFRQAGVEPGDTVVAYCRTGMQSSVAYFVARYLGYETKMYDASFMDWSRRPELPVER